VWTIGFTTLTAFALVVALASWLSRIIARSVGHAARAATALGKGGPLPSVETPVAEVNTLMAELRGAAAKRQAAEHDLQASKDVCSSLQCNPARVVAVRSASPRGSGDARFKEIFDVTADEISIEDLMKRVHPDDLARFSADREAALDSANPKPYAHEFRIRRADGEVRWAEGYGLAYFEGAGPERRAVSFGGTIHDITERKSARKGAPPHARNQSSRQEYAQRRGRDRSPDRHQKSEDFVERFSERIQALSANQDLLVRNEWNGVEIADLVRAQLAHFADLIGSRIAMHGPKLRLNPASAQAIGLALHELATNAGKIRGACRRMRACRRQLGERRRHPHHELDRARGAGRVGAEAARVRHHCHGNDGGSAAWTARSTSIMRLRPHLAPGCPAANALEPRERAQISGEGENRT